MDRKRKADENEIVIPEMDMSDNALDESISSSMPSDAGMSKMVLHAGTSSGLPSDASISARLLNMVQDAGTSACQNPAVTALLSMAAENVDVACTICTVTILKKTSLLKKQLPEYPLVLDAVRLKKLRALKRKRNELAKEHVVKLREAEMDYQQKLNPLYQRRNIIVAGVTGNDKGVPDFWLSALLGSTLLDDEITKQDEQPLKHLMKINCYNTDAPEKSLKLEFVFDSSNPFFENTVLTKTIYFKGVQGAYVVDRTEGTTINWKKGKCLNPRYVRNGREGRHRKSFFNFFLTIDEHTPKEWFVTMKLHELIANAIESTVMRHAYTLYMDTKASGKL